MSFCLQCAAVIKSVAEDVQSLSRTSYCSKMMRDFASKVQSINHTRTRFVQNKIKMKKSNIEHLICLESEYIAVLF